MATPWIERQTDPPPEAGSDWAGKNVACIVKQVQQAVRDGQQEHGCALAHNAIEAGIRHPSLYYLRALGKGRREEYQQALADFELACALSPADPVLQEAVGHCLTMLGRFREAIDNFDSAIALRPGFVRAHYRKGVAFGLLNEIDDMRAAFRRVVELEPQNTDALAHLAYIAARKGETGEARKLGEYAIRLSPSQATAHIALAIVDICEGHYRKAEEKLASILHNSARNCDGRLNMALGFAADALDRRGRYSEAFQLYTEVNARRRFIHQSRFASCRAIDDVKKLIEATRRSKFRLPDGKQQRTAADPAGHIFLLGFVRSGTTLLETILAGDPRVTASDENDFLASAANEFLHGMEDLKRLENLDDDDLQYWRKNYWDAVRMADFTIAGKVFVDKVPLNSLRLPLIATLFPEARILLAIRDPRDVVLSAFRHRFNMYPASFEFLALHDCAQFYCAVMQLVQVARNNAPFLSVYEVHYEDLIGNLEGTMRKACGFVGIDWNESMRQFQNASSVIDRRSQSIAQVQRGLYQGAAGHWRHYQKQLAPMLPILASWIEQFGYLQNRSPG